jgi:C4-type Zn-finger protein
MSVAIAAQNQSNLIRSGIFKKFPEELKNMVFAESASTSHQAQPILQSDQSSNRNMKTTIIVQDELGNYNKGGEIMLL